MSRIQFILMLGLILTFSSSGNSRYAQKSNSDDET